MQIEFQSQNIPKQRAVVSKREYSNGRPALQVLSSNGEPLCTATVNLPEADVPEGHVLVKNYSENRGVLDALIKAGVVGEPIAEIPTGFVMVQVCELLYRSAQNDRS